MSDLSSAERKRIRDRRSQKNLRAKKENYTAQLEAQVAHCEQHHTDQGVQQLLGIIKSLRNQNEILVARQKTLKSMVNSWDDRIEDTGAYNVWMTQGVNDKAFEPSVPPNQYNPSASTPQSVEEYSPDVKTSSIPISSPSLPCSARPQWNRLPLYADDFSNLKTVSCPWFFHMEQIMDCPDTPASPLEILYGSKTNPLANMIHKALERRPIREPERLAMGWVAYHFSRWILAPSPKTFASLPSNLNPVEEQFQIKHPLALSCIPWPKVRSNMIRQWLLYDNDREGLFGMLACCIKIRWPWGVKILERDENDELCIKPAFYDIFMSEEGWGITPEFLSKYPSLTDGVDLNSLVFNMT
ncbi:uncharacterized protein N7484_002605 [Penicillium longicatenatum]|uniref:uncharacterized protein n=1 Tax=Penicillium longicatenatum TaxID=1561947 RepID=UPI002547F91B|nr:uncharacterized protein N7484_002605 [Penicillium longicatenatum]KAJ5648882.1 hypothetical protein N7484_002605 [Penicillium longicatenatum]